METKFKEYDIVRNTNDNQKYYIEKIEMIYDVDLGESYPTGYYKCRQLNSELPIYNRFPEEDLEMEE